MIRNHQRHRRTDRRTDVKRRHHRSIAKAWSGKNWRKGNAMATAGARAYNGGLGAVPCSGVQGLRAPGQRIREAKPPWSWRVFCFWTLGRPVQLVSIQSGSVYQTRHVSKSRLHQNSSKSLKHFLYEHLFWSHVNQSIQYKKKDVGLHWVGKIRIVIGLGFGLGLWSIIRNLLIPGVSHGVWSRYNV